MAAGRICSIISKAGFGNELSANDQRIGEVAFNMSALIYVKADIWPLE